MVTVIATQDFVLDGRQIHEGEAVDLEPVQAAVHAYQNHVSLDPMARATYQTREMRATEPVSVVVAVEPPIVKKRRRRTRKPSPA